MNAFAQALSGVGMRDREVVDAVNIADLARLARRRLPRIVWDYLEGGAEDEYLLRANREAFTRYRLQPRILTGNGRQILETCLFGTTLAAPFLIGPTGLNGLLWRDGDICLAKAAAAAGIGFVLSSGANETMEDVARQPVGPRWFQLYPWGDWDVQSRLVERARAAGYAALVVTVDTLTPGKRERDLRHRFAHQVRITPRVVIDGLLHPRWLASVWLGRGMPRMENVAEFVAGGADAVQIAEFTREQRNPFYDWSDVARLRDAWQGPLLIKGVMAPADAERAVAAGADGIIVSNHGGRQLDRAPTTIDVLPRIAATLAKRAVLLVDGGFRRGSDIVTALALGADAVLLGRATLYGLAAGGEVGATRAIEILRDEVARTLALLGLARPGEVSQAALFQA